MALEPPPQGDVGLAQSLRQFFEAFERPLSRREILSSDGNRKVARFYTRYEDNYIDFGVRAFFEEIACFQTEEGKPFTYRVHWTGRLSPLFVILIPGLTGRCESLALQECILLDHGFTTIVFNPRGIGDNSDLPRSFGVLEANDILKLVFEMRQRLGSRARAGVFGVCIGAAMALEAATRSSLIDAIVVEGTYIHPARIFARLSPYVLNEIQSTSKALKVSYDAVAPSIFCSRFP
ncbi:MAG: alpha/beta fold hydrolase, partial [Rhabdochlamydiaceae bacterium]